MNTHSFQRIEFDIEFKNYHGYTSGNQIQLAKKVKGVSPWQVAEWDDPTYPVNFVCGWILTYDDVLILSVHGDQDGDITHYHRVLNILTDPRLSHLTIVIQCCYPARVAKRHPELKDYLLNPDYDDVTTISCAYTTTDYINGKPDEVVTFFTTDPIQPI